MNFYHLELMQSVQIFQYFEAFTDFPDVQICQYFYVSEIFSNLQIT